MNTFNPMGKSTISKNSEEDALRIRNIKKMGTARIEDGCQIMAGASICELVRIGRHSIINTNASVDHECKIGSGVHVMPGATICGLVRLGDMVTIGSNATIFPRVEIGEGSIIGAGTVITKNIPANVIVHHKQDLTMRPVS